ncbi:hypothetical protein [Arcanobacterium phocae]|uniref:hypothetical protein n=1 Tax=Arcanobacterium phocae TaxID=131112 RepID=UPI001C0EEDAE|nr:hypothetical protein [Arcanobacterium phocae]
MTASSIYSKIAELWDKTKPDLDSGRSNLSNKLQGSFDLAELPLILSDFIPLLLETALQSDEFAFNLTIPFPETGNQLVMSVNKPADRLLLDGEPVGHLRNHVSESDKLGRDNTDVFESNSDVFAVPDDAITEKAQVGFSSGPSSVTIANDLVDLGLEHGELGLRIVIEGIVFTLNVVHVGTSESK